MVRALFQRGGQTQRGGFAHCAQRFYRNDLRFTFGQRAGFIKHQRGELTGALQCIGITYQHAVLCGAADTGNNRHRRCQTQRTRTGDNQHRRGDNQGVDNLRRRAEEVPDGGAENGNGDHHRHEHGGDSIRQLADFRLTALCLTHHLNNARQRGVAADSACAELDRTIFDHGTGVNAIAIAFLLRDRLTGQHRFIKPGFALANFTVNGDAVAGSQAQDHPRLNVGQRHGFFTIFRHHAGGWRRQVEQFFQRPGGALTCTCLQHMPQIYQTDNHGAGFVIKVAGFHWEPLRPQVDAHRIEPCDAGT